VAKQNEKKVARQKKPGLSVVYVCNSQQKANEAEVKLLGNSVYICYYWKYIYDEIHRFILLLQLKILRPLIYALGFRKIWAAAGGGNWEHWVASCINVFTLGLMHFLPNFLSFLPYVIACRITHYLLVSYSIHMHISGAREKAGFGEG